MAMPLPGQLITAGMFGFALQEAILGSDTAPTSSEADITGATLTFTTAVDSQAVVVHAGLWVNVASATGSALFVYCNVDGSNDSVPLRFQTNTSLNGASVPISKTWATSLAAAGSHTIKLRALLSGATGAFVIKSAYSNLIIASSM